MEQLCLNMLSWGALLLGLCVMGGVRELQAGWWHLHLLPMYARVVTDGQRAG